MGNGVLLLNCYKVSLTQDKFGRVIHSSDLLYRVVPAVIILYYAQFVERVDLMVSVLTTKTKQKDIP